MYHNVILSRVRATTLAAECNNYYLFLECVLALRIQGARHMRHIFIRGLPGSIINH